MTGPVVARLDALPRLSPTEPGEAAWTPIRHALGLAAFGVNAWHGPRAGDVVVERHDEVPGGDCGCAGHEELYLVLSGRARFVVDGAEHDAPAGTLLALAPNLVREARAAEPDTTVLAVGAPRGEPYAVAPWEQRTLRRAGLA